MRTALTRQAKSRLCIVFAITMAILTISACTSHTQERGDLWINAAESRLIANGSDVFPKARYELRLTVNNLSMFQNPPTSFDIGHFEAVCEMFGTDALAQNRTKVGASTVGVSGVHAAHAVEVPFPDFYHPPDGPVWPYWYIKCQVDPTNSIQEDDEYNNEFRFLFHADCYGVPGCHKERTSGPISCNPEDYPEHVCKVS